MLGAILANRVTDEITRSLAETGTPTGTGQAAGHGGVPDMATLPAPMRAIVEHPYGVATADLFLVATPFALLALVAVLFVKEKPLKTTSGMERLAEESATTTAGTRQPADQVG